MHENDGVAEFRNTVIFCFPTKALEGILFLCIFATKILLLQLRTQVTRHNRIGVFLSGLYLLILATSILHIHECQENVSVCQDCKEHVKHNAHIGQASIVDFNCVLCKIIHTDYITPEVLTFSAMVLLVINIATFLVHGVIRCNVALPCLRAPPVVR